MSPHSYRDHIDIEHPAFLSDVAVLQALETEAGKTPQQLSESRFRENVLRLQCRDLCRVGVLTRCAHDTFEVTTEGEKFLRGVGQYPTQDGLFDVERIDSVERPNEEWRITDFSILDAETVKQINLGIFKDAKDDEYGWVKGNPSLTERRIKNVKEFQIDRVMREFPTNEPLPQQCAHWMRAFAGLHFFPDANHRTGMNTLQILVEESDYTDSLPISEDVERFVLQSKLTRYLNSKIRFNTLWKRDAHYALWHQYFRNLLCDVPDRHPITPSKDHLRQTLHYARKLGENTDNSQTT